MIKTILSILLQSLLIGVLVYSGSFVYIEESAEKNEKTEKFEEAIHSTFQGKKHQRSAAQEKEKRSYHPLVSHKKSVLPHQVKAFDDFNVSYIYTTSYLDSMIQD